MPPDHETIKTLAIHDVQIERMLQDMDQMSKTMDSMQGTLTSIKETLAEARGGWRILMLIGGAGGALGAAVTHLLQNLPSK